MRLLYIFPGVNKGGVTSVLINRLNYLVRHTDFEIHFLADFQNDRSRLHEFDSAIHFHELKINKFESKTKLLIYVEYLKYVRYLRQEFQHFIDILNPDIITTFDVPVGYGHLMIPKLNFSAKTIIEFHNSYFRHKWITEFGDFNFIKKWKHKLHPNNLLFSKYEKLHNSYDYGVMLTEEDTKDRSYLKIPKKQIYNPLPTADIYTCFNQRDNIILAVGSLEERKNFLVIPEIIRQIKNQMGEWRVHIYGDGPQKKALEDRIQEYKLEKYIQLKGYTHNIREVYNNSKILLITSLYEGHPMNLLEAFSYHIPVLSYTCKCGPKETIDHGVNGFLIDFDENRMAEKLLNLIKDESLLEAMSRETTKDLSKFDNENIMEDWIELYNSIVLF